MRPRGEQKVAGADFRLVLLHNRTTLGSLRLVFDVCEHSREHAYKNAENHRRGSVEFTWCHVVTTAIVEHQCMQT